MAVGMYFLRIEFMTRGCEGCKLLLAELSAFQASLSELESKNRELEGILQAKDAEVMALKHQIDQLTNDFLYNLKVDIEHIQILHIGWGASEQPGHAWCFLKFELLCLAAP